MKRNGGTTPPVSHMPSWLTHEQFYLSCYTVTDFTVIMTSQAEQYAKGDLHSGGFKKFSGPWEGVGSDCV